jgi:hypothetical protein
VVPTTDAEVFAGQTARPGAPAPIRSALLNEKDSIKFGVIGDSGTGNSAQRAIGELLAKARARFPFEFVIMLGDNMYGGENPSDFVRKFEQPYKPILDAGVKFYASLGNHDDRNQRSYEHFNMQDRLYYSFKGPEQDVRFFALESTYPDPEQIAWLEQELKAAGEDWKIAYFHHPLYSSGGRHGSDVELRAALEPLFIRYNVSVVFAGHDHFYERVKPQHGIVHFVLGSGGKLAPGDIDPRSPLTARGYDQDLAFLVAEIIDDQMYFHAVTRQGQVIDSGIVLRRQVSEEKPTARALPMRHPSTVRHAVAGGAPSWVATLHVRPLF